MLVVTELGQKLKEARETKGLSVDQLHEITKIQKRHLVAIEEGNYDVLPGAFMRVHSLNNTQMRLD